MKVKWWKCTYFIEVPTDGCKDIKAFLERCIDVIEIKNKKVDDIKVLGYHNLTLSDSVSQFRDNETLCLIEEDIVLCTYYVCSMPPLKTEKFQLDPVLEDIEQKQNAPHKVTPNEEGKFIVVYRNDCTSKWTLLFSFESTKGATRAKYKDDIMYNTTEVHPNDILPVVQEKYYFYSDTPGSKNMICMCQDEVEVLCDDDFLNKLVNLPRESRKRALEEQFLPVPKRELCVNDQMYNKVNKECKKLGICCYTQEVLDKNQCSKFSTSKGDLVMYHKEKFYKEGKINSAVTIQVDSSFDISTYEDNSIFAAIGELTSTDPTQKVKQMCCVCLQVASYLMQKVLPQGKHVDICELYCAAMDIIQNTALLIKVVFNFKENSSQVLIANEEITINNALNRLLNHII